MIDVMMFNPVPAITAILRGFELLALPVELTQKGR